IGAANWAPTNHSSGTTPALAKLIFLIGTKAKLDFGEYVFE
ncbi:envelope-like protein, partial [Trifolium medium]|nr:envelope-like protein [Trifolium medium]